MWSKRLVVKAIRHRFVITLPGNEGAFSGVLVDHDQTFWVFDQCATVASKPGQTPDEIAGRVWVKHAQNPAPYLQEIDPIQ